MSAPSPPAGVVRHRIGVAGVVQGVGFRLFVQRLAVSLGLAGHAGNDRAGVVVEVEGPGPGVERFEARLVAEAPRPARIEGVTVTAVAARGEQAFRILGSGTTGPARMSVVPDIATCDECLAELEDPGDRRYRYPFVNCASCGPRFTITVALPYDRPNTTMAGFPLCAECAAEYHDPTDRRFHAEPLSCPACGPRLWFHSPEGTVEGTDAALAAAHAALARGEVLAVKGLGGYHLACDATSGRAVARLRRRKGHSDRPFAVMVRDLAAAAGVADLDPAEAAALASPARPIVLAARRAGGPVSTLVAPSNPQLGVLLAYTPLHHLLFDPVPGLPGPVPDVLVMTSGNLSDEPICYDDADAQRRLGPVADGWLVHDRPIHVPCDDSVVRIVGGRELPIRRSRGYAPLPVHLGVDVPPVLATGGEVKNASCAASGREAWMSQHVGDMGSAETLAAFDRSARQVASLHDVTASRVATDAHPGYESRRWAEDRYGPRVVLVQHHHAHIAAVMAEHGLGAGDRVIGFAFDGTGYGADGAIWGGEVLIAGFGGFERTAHLRYVPLPGGDATVRRPYRAALAHLWAAGIRWSADLAPVRACPPEELAVLDRQLARHVHCVPTSSMGRLFDAVGSLLGVRHVISYEAQAAQELEAVAAAGMAAPRPYRFAIPDGPAGPAGTGGTGPMLQVDPGPLLVALVADVRAGEPVAAMAAGFHVAVARVVGEVAGLVRDRCGLERVALSGGVFQNALLVERAAAELAGRGFEVLTHRLVPPNDGGLALGQATVAGAARRVRGGEGR